MSRTLSGLSWDEVRQIVRVLDQVSQPYIDTELKELRSQGKRVRLDGDLTGLPVSNTSRTYPNAAFGHMNDDIRLGYQAAVVSTLPPPSPFDFGEAGYILVRLAEILGERRALGYCQ